MIGTGKVLVTGATGFLGGAVCRLLARRGWPVTANEEWSYDAR